jgi:hypothetical protein
VNICLAGEADLTHLARLLWLHAAPDEQVKQSVESFAVDLAAWWTERLGFASSPQVLQQMRPTGRHFLHDPPSVRPRVDLHRRRRGTR